MYVRTFSEGYCAEEVDLHDTSVSSDTSVQPGTPRTNASIVDEDIHLSMYINSRSGFV